MTEISYLKDSFQTKLNEQDIPRQDTQELINYSFYGEDAINADHLGELY